MVLVLLLRMVLWLLLLLRLANNSSMRVAGASATAFSLQLAQPGATCNT